MTDYYTDADHIRETLNKCGPLTRVELADKTNLPRETLAKSLYALKKQGDVIEEGDRLMLTKIGRGEINFNDVAAQIVTAYEPLCRKMQDNGSLSVAEDTESPNAAPKPSDPSNHTTPPPECSTGQSRPVDEDFALKDRTVDEIAAEDARRLVGSVSELVQAYRTAFADLSALKAKLRDLSHE